MDLCQVVHFYSNIIWFLLIYGPLFCTGRSCSGAFGGSFGHNPCMLVILAYFMYFTNNDHYFWSASLLEHNVYFLIIIKMCGSLSLCTLSCIIHSYFILHLAISTTFCTAHLLNDLGCNVERWFNTSINF